MTNVTFAVQYAMQGLPVFPVHSVRDGLCTCKNSKCENPGKHPATSNGFKSATTNVQAVGSFWSDHPHANIGIATGQVSGIVVIDIDPRHGGDTSLAELRKQFGNELETLTAETGGGGQHLYFRWPGERIGNRVAIMPGIDVRGDGGYIISPPSAHQSGNAYRWPTTEGFDRKVLRELNGKLLAFLRSSKSRKARIPQGSRNDSVFRFATSVGHHTQSRQIVSDVIDHVNETQCEPPLPRAEVDKILESAAARTILEPWSDPKDLRTSTIDAPAMAAEMVPAKLRPWITDISERMNCPIEMVAVPAFAAFAGLIGRRCAMKPKENDNWTEIPNLWGMLVAPPSRMKSSILKSVYAPIYQMEDEAYKAFLPKHDEHRRKVEALTFEVGLLKRSAQNTDPTRYGEKAVQLEKLKASEPHPPRFIVNDVTVEKLGELLVQNPNGLILLRDELSGFLFKLQKPGHESDRSFYLEAWTGSGRNTSDRIGRGTTRSTENCISIFGTIQPDVISKFFQSTLVGQDSGDGLFQRFQLMVYPALSSEFNYVDRRPDATAERIAHNVFRRVLTIDFVRVCGDFMSSIPTFCFTSDAQTFAADWFCKIERQLRSGMIESPAYEAHLGKFRGFFPSLALIIHLIEFDPTEPQSNLVTLEEAKLAAKLCEFFQAHSAKLYSMHFDAAKLSSHLLAEKILEGSISDGASVRSIYRKQWSGLSNTKVVTAGLEELEVRQWVRIEKASYGKSDIVRINPAFLDGTNWKLNSDGSLLKEGL